VVQSRCLFFLQAEDGIRDRNVTGVQTCALPICWKDAETALLQQEGEEDSIIIRDSKAYMVTHEGGKPNVMDLTEMTELLMALVRSEERRVGKESKSGWVTKTQERKEE